MNKFTIIACLAIIAICSCKKNDSGKPTSNFSITGKWVYTQDTVKEYDNGILTWEDYGSGMTFDGAYFQQFNADGTGIENSNSIITHFNYSVAGNVVTINTPAQTIHDPVNGDLPVTASIEKGTIKMISNSKMELYFDDISNDGGDKSETTEAAYFVKQ